MNGPGSARWILAGAGTSLMLIIGAVVIAGHHDAAVTTSSRTTTTITAHPMSSKPLAAPKTTVAEEAQYLTDVTEVDPALTSYEKTSGNVALRSLLTDGSAFCAFLSRDRDIDTAMLSVAVGARQVESHTHLPLTVTTFNSVDAVALLTLCPSLQSVVPSRDLVNIRKLGAALTASSG